MIQCYSRINQNQVFQWDELKSGLMQCLCHQANRTFDAVAKLGDLAEAWLENQDVIWDFFNNGTQINTLRVRAARLWPLYSQCELEECRCVTQNKSCKCPVSSVWATWLNMTPFYQMKEFMRRQAAADAYEWIRCSFPVAQMVEHGASNAKIMGSIPRESKSWSNVKL